MSVSSGVPVFRNADGTMSSDFTEHLQSFNDARQRHGLRRAKDWFDFSVPGRVWLFFRDLVRSLRGGWG
jgi:hypothetical protein